jgi:AcrR family transcriptional regulator
MSQQLRASRTRAELVRSAAEAFQSRGFDQAKLASISSGAGVSTGGLHFHFENKASIAEAVEIEAATALRAVAHEIRGHAHDSLQRLIDTSHALAYLLVHNVVVRAGFQLSCEITRDPAVDLRNAWRVWVERLVARAADEGSLKSGSAPHEVAETVVAATTGFEILGRDDPKWLSRQALGRFWNLLLPPVTTAEAMRRLSADGTEGAIRALEKLDLPLGADTVSA